MATLCARPLARRNELSDNVGTWLRGIYTRSVRDPCRISTGSVTDRSSKHGAWEGGAAESPDMWGVPRFYEMEKSHSEPGREAEIVAVIDAVVKPRGTGAEE